MLVKVVSWLFDRRFFLLLDIYYLRLGCRLLVLFELDVLKADLAGHLTLVNSIKDINGDEHLLAQLSEVTIFVLECVLNDRKFERKKSLLRVGDAFEF